MGVAFQQCWVVPTVLVRLLALLLHIRSGGSGGVCSQVLWHAAAVSRRRR